MSAIARAVSATAQTAAAVAGRTGGRKLSSLFNEDEGPLKRRKVPDALGGTKTVTGAECFFCNETTSKTKHLVWYAHLVGRAGDKGQGWKFCQHAKDKMIAAGREHEYDDLRKEYEALLAHAAKPERVLDRPSPNRIGAAGSSPDATAPNLQDQTPTALGFGDGEPPTPASADGTEAKPPALTEAIRKLLDQLVAMSCFEGNIAPHALVQNQSFRNFYALALSGFENGGDAWAIPSEKVILGRLLEECYQLVKDDGVGTLNPGKEPQVLTLDGWDSVQKLKLLNSNHAGSLGSLFMSILDCDGANPNAEWIAKQIETHIEANGGVGSFVQVVQDNTSANVNANEKLEEAYRWLLICTGCLAHMLNLAFKEIVADPYVEPCFAKLKKIVHFFNHRKSIFLPVLHRKMGDNITTLHGDVSTRFYSMLIMGESTLRAKDPLQATVMSTEWEEQVSRLDAEGKRTAR